MGSDELAYAIEEAAEDICDQFDDVGGPTTANLSWRLADWIRGEGRAVVARALGLEWAEEMRRDNIEKARGSGFTD